METPNLNYIKELSGGDKTFEADLIGIIKLEFPQEKEVYYKNILLKNHVATAESVHKLKHKISIFGLERSYKLAVEYENDLINGDVGPNKEFEATLKNIETYLNKI